MYRMPGSESFCFLKGVDTKNLNNRNVKFSFQIQPFPDIQVFKFTWLPLVISNNSIRVDGDKGSVDKPDVAALKFTKSWKSFHSY